jgi:hypothetical protein
MDKSRDSGALGVQGAELGGCPLIQRHPRRLLMTSMDFIGLDIHKKTISNCVKEGAGTVLGEGMISATGLISITG